MTEKKSFEVLVQEHNTWKIRRDELLPRIKEARDAVLEAQAEQMENRGDVKTLRTSQGKLSDLEQKLSACKYKMSELRTQLEKMAREELANEIAQMEENISAFSGERENLVKQIAHHLAQAQALAERCVNGPVFAVMLRAMSHEAPPLYSHVYDDLIGVHKTAFTEALGMEREKNPGPDYNKREQRLFKLRIMASNALILEGEITSRIFKAIGRPEPEDERFRPYFIDDGLPIKIQVAKDAH